LKFEGTVWDGRVIAAGRALCSLSSKELARLAGVSSKTVVKIEADPEVFVSPRQRHGCVSEATWVKLVGVLADHGIEVLSGKDGRGFGARQIKLAVSTHFGR
jgi:hypothetical protein